MDCTDIKVLLSGLIDDELEVETRHVAERHLAVCAACRDLVGEVEAVNQLIAADTTKLYGHEDLPGGFMNAVLGRTIAEDRRRSAGAWVNWIGWLAAASCLLLAVSAWLMQDGRLESQKRRQQLSVIDSIPQPTIRSASYLQSTVYHGGTSLADLLPDSEPGDSTAQALRSEPTVTRDDAETLDSASLLLEMLLMADHNSFSDVEQIREIVMYDEMLDRLATARVRLEPMDRTAVFAAESVLLRIVNGPLSSDDVRDLQETVRRSDLPSHLDSMSARWQPHATL